MRCTQPQSDYANLTLITGQIVKPTPIQKSEAFTFIELIVAIVVGFAMLALLLPFLSRARARSPRMVCINNLKQIATAYRIWGDDHHDCYPATQSVANGGWSDLLSQRANQGFMCWINYAIMSNEFGHSPEVLACPSDQRKPAGAFSNFVSNIHLSYLLGVSTDDTYPQSLLAGDRNLGAGTEPDRKYGFSPEDGEGNDVAIQTNSKAGPVCWSLKIHSDGNTNGAGNILLGDGSAQQVSSANLRTSWQPQFNPTTNWPAGHTPESPSIRVLFP
jgi:type II secretory pathway pseudopilin PulG